MTMQCTKSYLLKLFFGCLYSLIFSKKSLKILYA